MVEGQQARWAVARRHDVRLRRRSPVNDHRRRAASRYVPRPKSHFGTGRNADKLKASAPVHCISRAHGDTSKADRSTEDAISASSGYPVIEDDNQVVKLSCEKRYVTDTEGCGAIIRVVESQYDSSHDPAPSR